MGYRPISAELERVSGRGKPFHHKSVSAMHDG